MLAIICSRNVSNPNPGNMISEMLALIISRNVSKYNNPTHWQVYCPEVLAILFIRNAGGKCQQFFVSKMATNVNHYNFQKCESLDVSEMLTIIACRSPEHMIFRNVRNYNFQKCQQPGHICQKYWRQMLAIVVFENGDAC